jgi:hypothetical protein
MQNVLNLEYWIKVCCRISYLRHNDWVPYILMHFIQHLYEDNKCEYIVCPFLQLLPIEIKCGTWGWPLIFALHNPGFRNIWKVFFGFVLKKCFRGNIKVRSVFGRVYISKVFINGFEKSVFLVLKIESVLKAVTEWRHNLIVLFLNVLSRSDW